MLDKKHLLSLLLILSIGSSGITIAAPFIDMNFDEISKGMNPQSNTPYPEWALPPVWDDNYGPNNFFEVTDASSHSGTHSLRFKYQGRNGFCNTCGLNAYKHSTDPKHDGVKYFVSKDSSINLTSINNAGTINGKGPAAARDRLVFNKSAGFTVWQIKEIKNENGVKDRLDFYNDKPYKNGINGEPALFHSNDEVLIARECGVDGIVGKAGGNFQINRRSDCNNVITWFTMIPENFQPDGTSVFRRVYLKAELTKPPSGQKLNYTNYNRGNSNTNAVKGNTIFNAHTESGVEPSPQLGGLGDFGGLNVYKPGAGLPEGLKFERGTWYYVEQEYKSESSVGASDGAYRLWFAKSGEETTTPLVELTGIPLPPIRGGSGSHMSLWGNFGHDKNTYGAWYIDDLVISNTKIGPLDRRLISNNNSFPSKAPR